jgi:hypothetical protein
MRKGELKEMILDRSSALFNVKGYSGSSISDRFERLRTPLPAAKIKEESGKDVVFGVTAFTFANYNNGLKVWQYITKNYL